jgi:hypothetical protein
MRLGFALPQVGPLAGPDSISKAFYCNYAGASNLDDFSRR